MKNLQTHKRAAIGIIGALLLSACGNSSSILPIIEPPAPPPPPPPAMVGFQATVTDITNGQPFSPTAIIVHQAEYSVFTIGSPATVGLETLAEGGDNAELIAEADADANVFATATGAGPIPPGGNEAISIEFLESDLANAFLSVSTMLVNTNDAFTGVNGVSLADLAVGDSVTMRGVAYDAGTEANTELAGQIPGPAGGGEGFNADRDDREDAVTMHPGVVTTEDGLVTSALNGQHKFDNPVIQVRIERTE